MNPNFSDGLLDNNTYYTYIFALFSLLAFSHLVVPSLDQRGALMIWVRRSTFAAISIIALIGGSRLYFLHHTMYLTYSKPMSQLVREIENLELEHRQEPDFSFSLAADCGSVYLVPWFADHAYEKHQRYTIATALFPHEERDNNGKYILRCSPPPKPSDFVR